MKTKPIAFLACRILAIVFVMRALLFANITLANLMSFSHNRITTLALQSAFFSLIAPTITWFIGGVILWARADGISSRMVRGIEEEQLDIQARYTDLQIAGFAIVGLIILTTAIPDIFQGIPRFISLSYTHQYEPVFKVELSFWVIEKTIRLAIGSLLLFGSRGMVHLVSSIRTIGVNRADES